MMHLRLLAARILQSERFTKRYQLNWLFVLALIGVIFLGFILWVPDYGENRVSILYGLIVSAILLIFSGIYLWRMRFYSHRAGGLQNYAAMHQASYADVLPPELYDSVKHCSLLQVHNARDPDFRHCIDARDWQYLDLSYKIYYKTNRGEVHGATVYYGVMSAVLPRKLPNILFDSKKARGRQFKFEFSASQRHFLEGDFNKYFDVYMPDDYSIDGLSIITPDVMLALIDAADYDIEIIGNRLNLYGPLYRVDHQLPDMRTKLEPIRRQLMDNIVTYRDERLPYHLGRQTIAAHGMRLKRSIIWKVVGIVTTIFWVVFWIAGRFAGY